MLLSETLYAGDELLERHAHERAYVSVLIDGSYTEVHDSDTRLCGGATMIYHPPGEAHADHFGRPGRCLNIELTTQATRTLAAFGFAVGRRTVVGAERSPGAARVIAAWNVADAGATARILLDELAAYARRERYLPPRPPWFAAALATIEADLTECRSVAAVAEAVGVHPTHLAREFRRRFQCSPTEYRRRRRFESAARSLRESDADVGYIAHASGFADHSHLTRTFKLWSGMTPALFRARFFGRASMIRMRVTTAIVVALAAWTSSSAAGASAADMPLARLPLLSNGLLTAVPVTVGGTTRTFVLDTGASTTVVDARTERALRLRVVGTRSISGAGKGRVSSDRLAPLAITLRSRDTPPITFTSKAPLALDLGHVGTAAREDGLLGFDFFRAFVVDIDYDARTVSLYDPRNYVHGTGGAAMPVAVRRNHAFLGVTVDAQGVAPERHSVMLDLGSEDAIDDDIVLRSTAPAKPIRGGSGIGSAFAASLGTIGTLRLGSYVLHDLPSATGGVQLIGSAVLRKFHVVYDFAHGRIFLAPRASTRFG